MMWTLMMNICDGMTVASDVLYCCGASTAVWLGLLGYLQQWFKYCMSEELKIQKEPGTGGSHL
jgi:hypothetical protein